MQRDARNLRAGAWWRGWASAGSCVVALLLVVSTGVSQEAAVKKAAAPKQETKPAPAGEGEPAAAEAEDSPFSLLARFRFQEIYREPKERAKSSSMAIDTYRVAYQEVITTKLERAKGGPETNETIAIVRYTERPAVLTPGADDEVLSVVRRYDSARLRPDPRLKPSEPMPLEGLILWLESRPGRQPLVMELNRADRGHAMLDTEYQAAAYQQAFVPHLQLVLPRTPVAIGAPWRLSTGAAENLLGGAIQSGSLTGKLLGVSRIPDRPSWFRAMIGVSGRVQMVVGQAAVNAQVSFFFRVLRAGQSDVFESDPLALGKMTEVDGIGGVTQLKLAQEEISPVGPDRLRQTRKRELILERRVPEWAGEAIDAGLTLPKEEPKPGRATTWLTYQDPEGRYHFEYPQDFEPDPGAAGDGVFLLRDVPEASGPDVIRVDFREKDQAGLTADELAKRVIDDWQKRGAEVIKGPQGWLPDEEAGPGRRVFRMELALTPRAQAARADAANRILFAGYLIQFGSDQSVYLEATTAHESPQEFRSEVGELLKSLDRGSVYDPPQPAEAPARPANPATGG